MFDLIVVRYGELALKSKNIRRRFENTLIRSIRYALEINGIKADVEREWGRIYIITEEIGKTKMILRKIFGIVSFSPAIRVDSDIQSIERGAIRLVSGLDWRYRSFAIRASRVGRHNFTSKEVAVEVGRSIKDQFGIEVNLDNPDIEIFIDVREHKTYISNEKIGGAGGLPSGTQGKILSLIGNKKDILALWFMIKRGCSAKVMVFEEEEDLERMVEDWYLGRIVKIVEDSDINREISGCFALATGETIEDIKKNGFKLDKDVDLPILRPLISMNEREIDDIMRRVGI